MEDFQHFCIENSYNFQFEYLRLVNWIQEFSNYILAEQKLKSKHFKSVTYWRNQIFQ
jgi:hypothetical protein